MKNLYNLVSIECKTEFAANRLAKKLASRWCEFRGLSSSGSTITLNAERYVLRYVEKQPEFVESVDLFSVSIEA